MKSDNDPLPPAPDPLDRPISPASLSGLNPDEITEVCGLKQSYRGRQIFKAICQGAESLDEITVLSKPLRAELARQFTLYETSVIDLRDDGAGTGKIVLECRDGYRIEAVLLRDGKGRNTACLSTQAGCGMGCAFCKTGTLGFSRNLTAAEIAEQFLMLQRRFGPVSNIVYMGMGEPLLNLKGVQKSAALFNHKEGLGISYRRMTVSTCGIVKGLETLIDEGPKLRLALSLVSGIQEKRERLMPSASANPLPELKTALLRHQRTYGKRITFEYVLLPGENDDAEDIRALKAFIGGFSYIVNVIPWNRVEGLPFRAPNREEISRFEEGLSAAGIDFTRRFSRGGNIDGACGQLGGGG